MTLQNVSGEGPFFETFLPYLPTLADEVRRLCPRARLYLQQTWGYADDYERLHTLGFSDHTAMYREVQASYRRAAELIKADGIIPSGQTVEYLYEEGVTHPHRDGFHMHLGVGRLALAYTWLETLTGVSAETCGFADWDVPVSREERAAALRAAIGRCPR